MNRQKIVQWALLGLGLALALAAVIWWSGWQQAEVAPVEVLALGATAAPSPTVHPGTPPGENASLVCSTSLLVIIILGAVAAIRLRKPPK